MIEADLIDKEDETGLEAPKCDPFAVQGDGSSTDVCSTASVAPAPCSSDVCAGNKSLRMNRLLSSGLPHRLVACSGLSPLPRRQGPMPSPTSVSPSLLWRDSKNAWSNSIDWVLHALGAAEEARVAYTALWCIGSGSLTSLPLTVGHQSTSTTWLWRTKDVRAILTPSYGSTMWTRMLYRTSTSFPLQHPTPVASSAEKSHWFSEAGGNKEGHLGSDLLQMEQYELWRSMHGRRYICKYCGKPHTETAHKD